MKIALNPSPASEKLKKAPLGLTDIFILNEIEGKELSGRSEPKEILRSLTGKYRGGTVILTLGKHGSVFYGGSEMFFVPAHPDIGPVEDTTAAGDTFTGYFPGGILKGMSAADAMRQASKASALCITRRGAAEVAGSRKSIKTIYYGRAERHKTVLPCLF